MDINHKRKNKVKIRNLKLLKELRVISKEEFKAKVYVKFYNILPPLTINGPLSPIHFPPTH
jgi:hypothetical protein